MNGFVPGELEPDRDRRADAAQLPGGLPLGDRRGSHAARQHPRAAAGRHGDGARRALRRGVSKPTPICSISAAQTLPPGAPAPRRDRAAAVRHPGRRPGRQPPGREQHRAASRRRRTCGCRAPTIARCSRVAPRSSARASPSRVTASSPRGARSISPTQRHRAILRHRGRNPRPRRRPDLPRHGRDRSARCAAWSRRSPPIRRWR